MSWKDVFIILFILVTFLLSVFNFRATQESIKHLYGNMDKIDKNFQMTQERFEGVYDELDWNYETFQTLEPLFVMLHKHDLETLNMLIKLTHEVEKNSTSIELLEEAVGQCLAQDEHLWYHLKQTRKVQNDIFNILEETERVFKEHYHGPRPLLY